MDATYSQLIMYLKNKLIMYLKNKKLEQAERYKNVTFAIPTPPFGLS